MKCTDYCIMAAISTWQKTSAEIPESTVTQEPKRSHTMQDRKLVSTCLLDDSQTSPFAFRR